MEKININNKSVKRITIGGGVYYDNTQNIEWWEEFGIRSEYIENGDDSSYIITDVTPIPNELSLNIECVFLNDITSTPFGCRPTGNASSSSNNIFQVNNTIRVDLLGDASLSIPKENDIPYNITYSGVDNVFTFNGKSYSNSIKKSSIEVPYPFAIFANNSEGALSVGSACVMRYSKFNINNKQYIPIIVTKQFVDLSGVTHNVDDCIMVNRLSNRDVPNHIGTFSGEIKLDNNYYFKSISEQNPYYDLGRRIAYGKKINISVSFEDTTINPYPLYGLFGSRQGYSQSTAYNTFIGRNDLPMATDVAVNIIPTDRKFTVTLEDGKGYIDGLLTTTDTTPVTEWNYNSFLYNVNTEGLGGPMNTYRLPIGTRVYGCQIYDVATGVMENNYQPQPDQTLKCTITGEVLPKLGINETDSWRVFKTDTNEEVLDGNYPIMDGLTHWWDSENQSGTTWTPKIGNVNINTSDSWGDGYFKKLPNDTCETAQFNVNWTSGCTFDILYNQLKFTETDVNSNFDTQLFSVVNQSNQEWLLNYTRQTSDNVLSFYSPTLLGGEAYYSTLTPVLNEFSSSVTVYNGNTNLKYYVNGNEELNVTTTVNRPGAVKFGMNRFIPVNNNLTALIKSIRIYNKVLTQEEINNNKLYDLKVLEQPSYEELYAIECNGSQWIDTGIYGDETTELGLEFALTSLTQQKIAGSRLSADSGNITFSYPTNASNNYFNIDFQNNGENRVATDYPFVVNQFYTAIASPTIMSINGYEQAVKNVTQFTTPTTLRIGDGYGLTYATNTMSGKIKRYWIKKNNVLIQDCVPAKLKIDYDGYVTGTVGMWDKVNNRFYGSKTLTSFIEVYESQSKSFNKSFNKSFK